MESAPMFSVIVPCRDDQMNLADALASILSQSVRDLEVIVVDDGSAPPLTTAVDPRVRLLRREIPSGPGAARNLGLEIARGRYVAFCDSDDVFTPDRLKSALERHMDGSDVVVCRQGRLGSAANKWDRDRHPLRGYSPSLGATTISRALCPRFDERFLACQDIEWWVRLLQQGLRVDRSSELGYVVGVSQRPRVLNSPSARLEFSYALLDLHGTFFKQDPPAHAFRLYRIAQLERHHGSVGLARRSLSASIKVRPTARAFREAARLSVHVLSRRSPVALRSRALPPISSRRARQFQPLRLGPPEAALRIKSGLVDVVARFSSPLKPALRGRARRLATRVSNRDPISVETAWGDWMLDPRDTRQLSPYADEVLETAVFARLCADSMVVVDVGANRGWYTTVAAARVGKSGRVLAVEPDPRMASRLRRIPSVLNGEAVTDVIECAVMTESGTVRLAQQAEAALSHVVSGDALNGGTVEVEAISYRDLLVRAQVRQADVVKIDVEGAEAEVLTSIVRNLEGGGLPPLIMFEAEEDHYRRSGVQLEEVRRLLSHWYSLFWLDYGLGGPRLITDATDRPTRGRNILAIPVGREDSILRSIFIDLSPC